MAELLFYKQDHWMDRLDPQELAERQKDPAFMAKYLRRFRKGDIIAAYPDGTVKEHVSNPAFGLLRVPELSIDDTQELVGAETREVNGRTEDVVRRARCAIKLDLLGIGEKTADAADITLSRAAEITVDKATLATPIMVIEASR